MAGTRFFDLHRPDPRRDARRDARREAQTDAAWASSATGEQPLAVRLDGLVSEHVHVMHDRRIPGTRTNIDHLVVAPSGVYVIEAKAYFGRVEKRDKGTLRQTDLRLYIENRDRSRSLDGTARQGAVVRRAIGAGIPIQPVLCFVGADWGLTRPFYVSGVLITWPRALAKQVQAEGPLGPGTAWLAEQLGTVLPPAGPS